MSNEALIEQKIAEQYRDQFVSLADDASFLWLLRTIAVNQAHYTINDVARLEQRVDAALDCLMTAPEQSWKICAEALQVQQAGEVFAAAILAFHSGDSDKIQTVVVAGLANDNTFSGLVSALAWLPGHLVHSWVKRFFTSKDLQHKYLAVAVCSARREDPQAYLATILQRADCLEHSKLYARSLRLIGELKRRDLSAALPVALKSDNPDIAFWAIWSGILLGDKSYSKYLQPYVVAKGPYQYQAIDLAFRVLPLVEAREWINTLAKDPAQIRNVIKASAALGDPQAVGWLIAQMQVEPLMRIAGEAFTIITGIDLLEGKLVLDEPPTRHDPDDDADDSNLEISEDEGLPFPDATKIAAVWQQCQQQFVVGQRYFMGTQPNPDHLNTIFAQGSQRQRKAAALELALLQPQQFLFNHAAKGLTS